MEELTISPSYARTLALDDVRAREYPLLDAQRHVYLDYTAANLAPRSLGAAVGTFCWMQPPSRRRIGSI